VSFARHSLSSAFESPRPRSNGRQAIRGNQHLRHEAGYLVDAVAEGDEVIDQRRFNTHDVRRRRLADARVSGLEVVIWARRNNRPTAMVMLTARDAPSDRIEGLHAGADDYMFNPTSTNLVPPMALSPCGRAGWREAGGVKHQADAQHTVKHLLDSRCQVSVGLLHDLRRPKTVSAMYALE